MGSCVFPLCYFLEMPFFTFDFLSSMPFTIAADNFLANKKCMILKCACDPSYLYKDFQNKVASWFSLDIGQNASRQLATSSEKISRQCSICGRIGDQ